MPKQSSEQVGHMLTAGLCDEMGRQQLLACKRMQACRWTDSDCTPSRRMSVFLEGPSAFEKNEKHSMCKNDHRDSNQKMLPRKMMNKKRRKINIKHSRDIAASKTSARKKGTWNSEKQTQRKGLKVAHLVSEVVESWNSPRFA